MPDTIDDTRIRKIETLSPPAELIAAIARTPGSSRTVATARESVRRILRGEDQRLLVVIGPCSIHDPQAALDYARRLAAERVRLGDQLEILMRVYFEKPRTTVGWKGLINDPHLDGSFRIEEGMRLARALLRDINDLGVPAACEFLDVVTPQYIGDLVSWGAIGARTTESQIHREMASGLSCPVGFKNGTGGDVGIAIDAIQSASQPHHFLAVTKAGRVGVAATAGNEDCHVVLRGGRAPNYDAGSVAAACAEIAARGLEPRVMIDASHANSGKDPQNQPRVIEDVAGQLAGGAPGVFGVMVESHLVAGRQSLVAGRPLVYGQSITDGCLGWEESVGLLDRLADAVRARRRTRAASAVEPAAPAMA